MLSHVLSGRRAFFNWDAVKDTKFYLPVDYICEGYVNMTSPT